MIEPIPINTIIKGILDAPQESRAVELKPSLSWSDVDKQVQIQNIIKSILGMSNVRDGGKIILGIRQNQDRTFTVEGIAEEDLKTYDSENIYQDVRKFGEPEPRFEVKNMEYNGRYFIVFVVQEFLFSPVICSKNGKHIGSEPLVRGALYIRPHKPETKKVDNETEMREIINLAIEKELDLFSDRMQKVFKTVARLKVPKAEIDSKKFIDEISDIL